MDAPIVRTIVPTRRVAVCLDTLSVNLICAVHCVLSFSLSSFHPPSFSFSLSRPLLTCSLSVRQMAMRRWHLHCKGDALQWQHRLPRGYIRWTLLRGWVCVRVWMCVSGCVRACLTVVVAREWVPHSQVSWSRVLSMPVNAVTMLPYFLSLYNTVLHLSIFALSAVRLQARPQRRFQFTSSKHSPHLQRITNPSIDISIPIADYRLSITRYTTLRWLRSRWSVSFYWVPLRERWVHTGASGVR